MRVLLTRRGFFPDLSNNDYLSFILTGTGGTVQIDYGPPNCLAGGQNSWVRPPNSRTI